LLFCSLEFQFAFKQEDDEEEEPKLKKKNRKKKKSMSYLKISCCQNLAGTDHETVLRTFGI
jgi:hypothetical protein